jgi:hypothetical protein
MKKIAIFGSIAIAMLACIGFTACNNDVIETPEPEVYTVKLGWAGEILDVSYEPMETRAAGNDLYGIKVYSKPNTEDYRGWTAYAYGLFDDPSNITITLAGGYKYRFVASMVKDGKNRINKNYNGGYSTPFSGTTLDNKFYYDITKELVDLDNGAAYLVEGSSSKHYSIPNIERYYGELNNYIQKKVILMLKLI